MKGHISEPQNSVASRSQRGTDEHDAISVSGRGVHTIVHVLNYFGILYGKMSKC